MCQVITFAGVVIALRSAYKFDKNNISNTGLHKLPLNSAVIQGL
jgi:hypothetical protein